jgi:hypothetical protein
MSEESRIISEQEKESLKFFERDFNQCFHQMRYYDSQIFDILKFIFAAYSALIGVSLGLYQFGLKESRDFTLPTTAALLIGLILGFFMLALVIRNRAYFVQVARYINEQRGYFFQHKPPEFRNESRMYTDCSRPRFLNWRSSQLFLAYIIATLNSTLCGVLLFISLPVQWKWWAVGIASIVLLILQLGVALTYLRMREKKSSHEN